MNFTLEQQTQILRMTLARLDDKEIAKRLKKRHVTGSTLVYARTKGALPKRKAVLGYIVSNTLIRLGEKWEEEGHVRVPLDFLIRTLNKMNILTPTNRPWTNDNLKRYFQKVGIPHRKKDVNILHLSSLVAKSLEDVALFDDTLNPEDYLPSVESASFLSTAPIQPLTGLGDRKEELKAVIQEALNHGAETIAQITVHLNELGYKNAAGKNFSRWSVKLLMQQLQLDCHKKVEASIFKPIMEDWVRTTPLTESISRNQFLEKLNSLKEEGTLLQNSHAVYSDLADLIMDHNKDHRSYLRGEEYREQVEHAVYVKYRHRPITAEEIGQELGLSPMQGNRVMREYLRIEPFDIWYENLYKLVKEYTDENPEFRLEDLAEYLGASYLLTQRGNVWDFKNTESTYLRLQKRYPDLPNSIGRR